MKYVEIRVRPACALLCRPASWPAGRRALLRLPSLLRNFFIRGAHLLLWSVCFKFTADGTTRYVRSPVLVRRLREIKTRAAPSEISFPIVFARIPYTFGDPPKTAAFAESNAAWRKCLPSGTRKCDNTCNYPSLRITCTKLSKFRRIFSRQIKIKANRTNLEIICGIRLLCELTLLKLYSGIKYYSSFLFN